jgi:hypothetical protein
VLEQRAAIPQGLLGVQYGVLFQRPAAKGAGEGAIILQQELGASAARR